MVGPLFKLVAGDDIYANETGTISANKLLEHRPISSNINNDKCFTYSVRMC